MNLCPHRVSFLLPWGQTAFPGQRGKLRTGLEARGTTGMSLGISQSAKTQNAYTCPEIFHLWFVFSEFTSDKCSETPTCSSKKVLQDSNFAKVKITSASFSLPFNPCQSPFLPHENKHEFNVLSHPWLDTESKSASLDLTLSSLIRLPASLEYPLCS